MRESILQFMTPYQENKLLFACSGGVDSMVLFQILHKANFDIAVVHFNHKTRGEENKKDAALVNEVVINAGRVIHNIDIELHKKEGNFQEQARKQRYMAMEELCRKNAYEYIITAHHQDDQVETVIMNFSRGTDLWGLQGISSKRDNILRPMMHCTKDQIRYFAKQENVPFREDLSNQSLNYRRNILRNQILPQLDQAFPHIGSRILASQKNVSDAIAFLEAQNEVFKETYTSQEGPFYKISKQGFTHPSLIFYQLFLLLRVFDFNKVQCRDLSDNLYNIGKHYYSKNYELYIARKYLVINPKGIKNFMPLDLDSLPMNMRISPYFQLSTKEVHKIGPLTLDPHKIGFPLKCRIWEAGDKILLPGMEGKRKKLKSIFNEMGLSQNEKKHLPLLLDNKYNIIWIPGFRVSSTVLADKSSKKMVEIDCVGISA